MRAFILGRISKRYDSQYVIFRTESNDLLCVETSRYAFDHNTWRGFDYGLAMIAYTLAFGFGEVEGIKNYGNYVLKVFPVLLLLILATLSVPVALTFITRSTSVSLLLSFLYIMGTAFVPGVFAKIKGLEFLTGGLRKRGSCIRTLRNKQLIRKHRK